MSEAGCLLIAAPKGRTGRRLRQPVSAQSGPKVEQYRVGLDNPRTSTWHCWALRTSTSNLSTFAQFHSLGDGRRSSASRDDPSARHPTTPDLAPACLRSRRFSLRAPGRSRTRNLMGRNHLLYPVELQGRWRNQGRARQGYLLPLPQGRGLLADWHHQRDFVAVLSALVVVAQLAERRDVAPEVAGSSPVDHPTWWDGPWERMPSSRGLSPRRAERGRT